jgi:hypothetical protein
VRWIVTLRVCGSTVPTSMALGLDSTRFIAGKERKYSATPPGGRARGARPTARSQNVTLGDRNALGTERRKSRPMILFVLQIMAALYGIADRR